jgi:hypothetical protein
MADCSSGNDLQGFWNAALYDPLGQFLICRFFQFSFLPFFSPGCPHDCKSRASGVKVSF